MKKSIDDEDDAVASLLGLADVALRPAVPSTPAETTLSAGSIAKRPVQAQPMGRGQAVPDGPRPLGRGSAGDIPFGAPPHCVISVGAYAHSSSLDPRGRGVVAFPQQSQLQAQMLAQMQLPPNMVQMGPMMVNMNQLHPSQIHQMQMQMQMQQNIPPGFAQMPPNMGPRPPMPGMPQLMGFPPQMQMQPGQLPPQFAAFPPQMPPMGTLNNPTSSLPPQIPPPMQAIPQLPQPATSLPQSQPQSQAVSAPPAADAASFEQPPYFPAFRAETPSSSINPVLVFNDRKITYKRNATHVAIAYYIYYQQRYHLAKQAKDQKSPSPITLSLDPTHDARMLKSQAHHPSGDAPSAPASIPNNAPVIATPANGPEGDKPELYVFVSPSNCSIDD